MARSSHTVLLVGDVMLGRLVNQFLRGKPPETPWGDTLGIFRAADVRIANLECVVSDREGPPPTPRVFRFRTDRSHVACLDVAQIDAVSLANNHVLDFGEIALHDTLEVLDERGIAHAGAGEDNESASRPVRIESGGLVAHMIAFTDNEPAWAAGRGRTGVFHVPPDPDTSQARTLFRAVESARTAADLIIVSAHWGSNWGYRPEPGHRLFARALVDHGADIVYGHSCHVFRGVEVYRGAPVLYSAGDFVDDYAVDEVERNDESFIFLVHLDGGRIAELELVPSLIREFRATLARGNEGRRIALRMQKLCADLGTHSEWSDPEERLRIPVGHGS